MKIREKTKSKTAEEISLVEFDSQVTHLGARTCERGLCECDAAFAEGEFITSAQIINDGSNF